MLKHYFAAFLICTGLFAKLAVALPVIQNGGFEADPSGGDVFITGWDHVGSTFSGRYSPHSGNINAVLTALHDVNQFTQMIPETTSGELFTVTFFLAPGYIYPGKISIFDVSFGGSTLEILSSRFAALGEYQEFDITGVGGPGDVTDLIFSVPQFVGDLSAPTIGVSTTSLSPRRWWAPFRNLRPCCWPFRALPPAAAWSVDGVAGLLRTPLLQP